MAEVPQVSPWDHFLGFSWPYPKINNALEVYGGWGAMVQWLQLLDSALDLTALGVLGS